MSLTQAEFTIVGEGEDFLAVNKPAGLLVHPTRPGGPPTLWDGLQALLGYEIATGGQVSLINRLDRETSGVVLVAKHASAARVAGMAMQRREIHKEYLALVFGWPSWETEHVSAPIIRLGEIASSAVWLERAVHPAGAPAETRFEVVRRVEHPRGSCALVRAFPLTGRTHQIRVHLAHLGHPVIGDKLYARGRHHYLDFIANDWTAAHERDLWLPRHALHSSLMSWADFAWQAPLPADMEGFLSA